MMPSGKDSWDSTGVTPDELWHACITIIYQGFTDVTSSGKDSCDLTGVTRVDLWHACMTIIYQ